MNAIEIIMRDRVTAWVPTGHDPVSGEYLSLEAVAAAKIEVIGQLTPLGLEPHGAPEISRIEQGRIQLDWRIRRAS